MPLLSKHFTQPKTNQRLEDCLSLDSAHIARPPHKLERGKHVALVQAALVRLSPGVNLGNEPSREEYGELTAAAVFRFKDTHTPKILNASLGQIVPDHIVGKRTIFFLDQAMLSKEGTPTTALKVSVRAVPLSGFSDLQLNRSPGLLSLPPVRDPTKSFCQMVPVGGFRNLFVSTTESSDRIDLKIPDPPHTRRFAAPGIVTVRSIAGSGEDLATFTINGVNANAIRLIVRPAMRITVNVHALANIKAGQGAVGFSGRVDSLIQGLNRIYTTQTNVTFVKGQFGEIDSVDGKKLDFDRPIFVEANNRIPRKSDPTQQAFGFGAFLPRAVSPRTEVNVFITPGLIDPRNPDAVGTSSGFVEGKLVWVNSGSIGNNATASRIVGHEIGHLLGLGHLDNHRGTLMFPNTRGGGEFIPADTLSSIRFP